MPLATLRGTSSFKDLRNGRVNRYDSSPNLLEPFRAADGTNDGRPESSSSYLKSALKPSSAYGNGPALASRPQTQQRFSFNKKRHASDPQLGSRYRQDASESESSTPSAAPAPIIGVTAPTWRPALDRPKRRFNPFAPKPDSFRSRSQNLASFQNDSSVAPSTPSRSPFKSLKSTTANSSFELSSEHSGANSRAPSSLHGEAKPSLSVPVSRVSGSSQSEHGSRRPSLNPSIPPAQKTASSTSSTFFKLPRIKRKKPKDESLFPLPVHLSPSNPSASEVTSQTATIKPVPPHSAQTSRSNSAPPSPLPPEIPAKNPARSTPPPASPAIEPGASSKPLPGPLAVVPPPPLRQNSTTSTPAAKSSPVISHPPEKIFRGRSGTSASLHSGRFEDERSSTPLHDSGGRNSMASTTIGRNSVAGIRSITSRWRHASDSNSPGVNSPKEFGSAKNDSFALSKETLVIPDREEGETAGRYYARLEADTPKKSIALTLSKSTDTFHQDVLRSLMRTFKFYEEPMDISLRKFLWEIDLPGEAQQIDRVMSAFAERYHECNPHIFNNLDQAYLAAYSLIILHSDLFNKNNKRKMQRFEYQKNTGGHGIDEEILGYFYDNIQYTEFIAQNPDDDDSDRKHKKNKTRKKAKKIKVATTEGGDKGKLDPYDFILDDRLRLEVLRPALKGVMNLDDTFNYVGSSPVLDVRRLQASFTQPGILQVISARSRPDAFTDPSTIENPLEAHPGVVEIKVGKVGVIWRKDVKKKKTRSPWQKWGALLTQSQLYFFRNVAWIEDLMKQTDSHQKHGSKGSVVFKPQLEEFKPDLSLRTMGIVALVDSTYDKHKNGFILASYDGFSDEVVLADSESEMNDWLAKINYCATFSCAGIAMEPVTSPAKDPLAKTETSAPSPVPQTSLAPPENSTEHPMTRQINVARREAIKKKIDTADVDAPELIKKLEENLKTARHLQILAPFPPKARSDLLTYGARVAHRVRWSRFDIWRLKCHREMLVAHLEIDGKTDSAWHDVDGPQNKSPKPSTKPTALSRFNSKASAIINPQKSHKRANSHGRNSASAKSGPSQEADLAKRMDQAFATPAENITKSGKATESPFKLPPLALGSAAISVNSQDNNNNPEAAEMEDRFRHNSTASEASQAKLSEIKATPTPSVKGHDEPKTGEHRPSTAAGSDMEQGFASPPSSSSNKNNVRRSLQRTLRDSREYSGHPKSKRHKDSVSTITFEDNPSVQDHETLQRGTTGSFTVHGKKASVIKFGSEWQNITPEERLRARKQALSEETATEAGLVGPLSEQSNGIDQESATMSQESPQLALHSAPVSDGQGVIVDHAPEPVQQDADSSRASSMDIPFEQSAADSEVKPQSNRDVDASHEEESSTSDDGVLV